MIRLNPSERDAAELLVPLTRDSRAPSLRTCGQRGWVEDLTGPWSEAMLGGARPQHGGAWVSAGLRSLCCPNALYRQRKTQPTQGQ
ncbi:hypothetical protein SKAU_G00161930 [Synaphobranchus kaupii]|uniref:Uncharacterized protein n=1 Tax=Synaphobranchus kaupii TaxID=118154 RepID=A0A9Q1FIV5_SYNKA|nr:hypothetical protein SKAU_G00161930 [Synaphobranchus kaupii]